MTGTPDKAAMSALEARVVALRAKRAGRGRVEEAGAESQRPIVTLSFAQSLDGCLAARYGQQTMLSGDQALCMTHALRAQHDAILIGVGTLLADDPRLTVRVVEGRDPQRVVLDTELRTPPTARLFQCGERSPWIVCAHDADAQRAARLREAGARLMPVERGADQMLALVPVLAALDGAGIGSIMVEGGARVAASFLAARLIDLMVLTIAPVLIGARDAVRYAFDGAMPRVRNPVHARFGDDLVVYGEAVWDQAQAATRKTG